MKKKKNTNKRTLFILVPLFALSMLAFIFIPRQTPQLNPGTEGNSGSLVGGNYAVDEPKQEAPVPNDREPVVISIFKFIVNCNPFKKEAAL